MNSYWHPIRFFYDRAHLFRTTILFLGCSVVSAQQSSQPVATFQAQTKLVNVYASVRDNKGKIVRNLNKEDFLVQEDGRPQSISFFSRESDMPLLLGLLVDTSPSEARMIDQESAASRSFLTQVMDPKKDKAFLIHFDRHVELLQDLTSSMPKMEKALDQLQNIDDEPALERKRENLREFTDEQPEDQRHGPDGPPGADAGGGTTHLFDAVYLASDKILKSHTGRKALIVIGDGDDVGSTISKERAIRAAQQADVLVYCIRIVDKDFGKQPGRGRRFSVPGIGIPGLGVPGMGPPGGGPGMNEGQGPGAGGPPNRSEGKKNLEALAGQTGGALFEVSKKVHLDEILAQIQEELRSLYSLGYTPGAKAQSGYRHITVSVKQRGLRVQAREGYYAESD
jgi:VWFA-related protein